VARSKASNQSISQSINQAKQQKPVPGAEFQKDSKRIQEVIELKFN
jgi:hypothetical protein